MRSRYKLTGLNQLRKLKFILNNKIRLYSIKKLGTEAVTFEVDRNDEKNFVKFYTEKGLDVEKLSDSTSNKVTSLIKTSLIFLICFAVLFSGFMVIINIFLFKVEVNGVNAEIKKEIEEGFSVFTAKGQVNRIEMEKYLKAKYNQISLVSVSIKGTTLVVNIKEKNETIETRFTDLISDYDGVIKTIKLKSGTANVKTGDVVKQGDVLVRSEIVINGLLVKTNAEAEIEIIASARVNQLFKENRIELKPTGNYVDDVYWKIFKWTFKAKESKRYQYFYTEVIEEKNSMFSLIPVYRKRERMYELRKTEVQETFLEKEEEIKARVMEDAIKISDGREIITQAVTSVRLAEGVYNVVAEVQFCAIMIK